MKTRTVVAILILIVAVFIVSGGYATGKKAISEAEFLNVYSGTWINEDYDGSMWEPQVWVHYSDGTWDMYSNLGDDFKRCVGVDEIIDTWTDSNGNYWGTTKWECTRHLWKAYTMRKISDSGNTHELLWRMGDEPIEEWDVENEEYKYFVHYRQE